METQIKESPYPYQYVNRVPKKGDETVPIKEMVDNGEPVEVVRKKILYEYRPLYVVAFVVCFSMFTWAVAYTVVQLSDNVTAQTCFETGGEWRIGVSNQSECRRPIGR